MTQKIKSAIKKIKAKYGTVDPKELCEQMDIVLLFTDLPKQTRGFYMSTSKGSAIVVNQNLRGVERNACIAHELGHATLHGGLNYMFMHSSTQMVTGRYEKEANRFAALLLMQSTELYCGATIEQLARGMSLPQDAVEWAMLQNNIGF